ncbi:hypothetical protein KRM28CT15_23650 [Krasilnikovia sp. M28-CT-15]
MTSRLGAGSLRSSGRIGLEPTRLPRIALPLDTDDSCLEGRRVMAAGAAREIPRYGTPRKEPRDPDGTGPRGRVYDSRADGRSIDGDAERVVQPPDWVTRSQRPRPTMQANQTTPTSTV